MASSFIVSSLWSFHDTEEVLVSAELREGRLVVQVEENLTADQWRGQFDKKHIEELTRKTGNFKNFSVFLKMLESAITKSSDSVSLDLLTYSDLEALRNSKTSSSHKRSLSSQHSDSSSLDTTHTKRYLILTYSTAFDRIHYPLALPYNGQQDPAVLKNIIRSLSKELEKQKKLVHSHTKHSSITELQEQYDILAQEKEYLQEAYDSLQHDLSAMENESHSTRELRMLKKLTQTLEEDLLRERSKHQKILSKKNQEIKRLVEELDETRVAQRILNSRLKTLTNELAMNKREVPIVKRRQPSPVAFGREQRRNSGGRKTYQPSPSERSGSRGRRGVVYRNLSTARSPSPGGRARFDPSAYVESRRKRQQETASKLRNQRTPPSSGRRSRSISVEKRAGLPPRPSGLHSRNSSIDSKCSSRRSSVDSADSRGSVRNMLRNSQNKGRKPTNRNTLKGSLSEGYVRTSHNHVVASTPKTSGSTNKLSDSNLLDRSVEIDEIDARLLALQRFMKRSLSNTRTKH